MSKLQTPKANSYDVVIVGGAMLGSSVAWFTATNPDFNGSILVVEKDPTYEFTSTVHTNSCMRQQFSNEVNIRVSQFAADFVKNFREYMGGDERVPHPNFAKLWLYVSGRQRRIRCHPKRGSGNSGQTGGWYQAHDR